MVLIYGELARKIAHKEGMEYYYKKLTPFFRRLHRSYSKRKEEEKIVRARFLRAVKLFKAQGYGFYIAGYKWPRSRMRGYVLEWLERAYTWVYMEEREKNNKKT